MSSRDLEDRSVDLQPQQGFVVSKGVRHRTRAPDRAIILMVETAAIVPTGDAWRRGRIIGYSDGVARPRRR